ncbi:MAG: polymer-forming cytoskeletal protein [Gammaproteobacteria bacterium]
MFGKKNRMAIQVTKLSSLVAHNMSVKGDVGFEGGLRVDGRIEGNVCSNNEAHSLLVLSNKGTITGRVKVYDAVIDGHVQGDLEVEHFLELQANARISGNITYRQLKLDCGATVDGQLLRVPSTSAEDTDPEDQHDEKVVALIGASRA